MAFSIVLQKYMHEISFDKMRLDQLYVRYRSFWLDLDVLLWTLLILLPKISSTTLPEDLLFVGPFTRLIRRYLNWFTIDLMVTIVAMGFTGLVWRALNPLNVGWIRAIGMMVGFALIFSLSGAILGVNHISWSKATFADVYELLPAWIMAYLLAIYSEPMVWYISFGIDSCCLCAGARWICICQIPKPFVHRYSYSNRAPS